MNFRVPADPPARLADAIAKYDPSAQRLAEEIGKRREARTALKAAPRADSLDFAERLRDDLTAKPGDKHEQKATKALEDAEATIAALELVVDEQGDDAARAVGEVRDEWLATMRPRVADAAARYDAAVAELRAASDAYVRGKADLEWLETYTVEAAIAAGRDSRIPDVTYRGHARARVRIPQGQLSERVGSSFVTAPATLIESLAQLTAPPDEPKRKKAAPDEPAVEEPAHA
jgi:hypothetical protein